EPAKSGSSLAREAPCGAVGDQAQLAIILDDLGEDRALADKIFALHYPLTLSILPHRAHSLDIAAAAHARGYAVPFTVPRALLSRSPAATLARGRHRDSLRFTILKQPWSELDPPAPSP